LKPIIQAFQNSCKILKYAFQKVKNMAPYKTQNEHLLSYYSTH
jgi:hypothetical protein